MAIYSSISFTCNISFAIFDTYKYILNIILICLMCIPNVQYTIHVFTSLYDSIYVVLLRKIIDFLTPRDNQFYVQRHIFLQSNTYKFIWETTFHSSNNRFLSIKQFVSTENWWIFFLLQRFSFFLAQ